MPNPSKARYARKPRPRSSVSLQSLFATDGSPDRSHLQTLYCDTRSQTEWLCSPLEVEDFGVQSMTDVSPTKWHLAHSSWFFETFLLLPSLPEYPVFHPTYDYLFNSYYNTIGDRVERGDRGLMSRPTVNDIFRYRHHVDEHIEQLLEQLDDDALGEIVWLLELGMQHEQQHQELLLCDIKHVFGCNPLRPVYRSRENKAPVAVPSLSWKSYSEGVYHIGHDGSGFAFDNEGPSHRVFLDGFRLANRLVTNGEYMEFMADGGYETHSLWLSDGWVARNRNEWQAPMYWEPRDDEWWHMTLAGVRPVDPSEPVCHLSYYEADAFARWSQARLPSEAEWETVGSSQRVSGNFVAEEILHPCGLPTDADRQAMHQMFGDVWEWTSSPYVAYPGYRPATGAMGEYNGKFMCNQMVLRGGACVSPQSHIRATYRNFFTPETRWQFCGLRLAKS